MLKQGVDLRGLHPCWGVAYPIIQQIFADNGYPCVVTSANDSRHGAASLHYKGCALDLRTKHIDVRYTKDRIIQQVKERLGAQFDVVFESDGKPNEHLHVEFDPKEPPRSEEV